MAKVVYGFDQDSTERIARAVRHLEHEARNLRVDIEGLKSSGGQRMPPRLFKTTVNSAHPTYPTAPANTFVVKRIYPKFQTQTPGAQSLDDPVQVNTNGGRIARTIDGTYLLEDTWVKVEKFNNRFWITEHWHTMEFRGTLKTAITQASPTAVIENLVRMDGMTELVELTSQNTFTFQASQGAPAKVRWDGSNGTWLLVQIDGCS